MRNHVVAVAIAAAAVAACGRDRDGAVSRDTAAIDSAAAPVARGPGTAVKPSYVGLQYDSLPKGFTYHAGSALPPSPRLRNAEYDLSHVTTPNGDMVWLDTLGAAVGKGLRARIVRAELAIPPLASDERLFMASCDANGALDPLVVAIVVNEPGATRFTKIRQAWRANLAAGRFDALPLAGITCEDPGS